MKPRHILLVDDEPHVLRVLRLSLEREGYLVVTASDGNAALACMAQQLPDVLISDIQMDGMDGRTLCPLARKTYPDVPILFMSGYAEEQLRKSIDIANVAFLPKPFSVQELAQAVQRVLAGSK